MISLENKVSRIEEPWDNILYTQKWNDYALCGEVGDETCIHRRAGIMWGLTYLESSMAACTKNYKAVPIFFSHIVIPWLEIYPMELTQGKKS